MISNTKVLWRLLSGSNREPNQRAEDARNAENVEPARAKGRKLYCRDLFATTENCVVLEERQRSILKEGAEDQSAYSSEQHRKW